MDIPGSVLSDFSHQQVVRYTTLKVIENLQYFYLVPAQQYTDIGICGGRKYLSCLAICIPPASAYHQYISSSVNRRKIKPFSLWVVHVFQRSKIGRTVHELWRTKQTKCKICELEFRIHSICSITTKCAKLPQNIRVNVPYIPSGVQQSEFLTYKHTYFELIMNFCTLITEIFNFVSL